MNDGEGGTLPVCEKCIAQWPTDPDEDRTMPPVGEITSSDESPVQEDASGDFVGCPLCKVYFGELDAAGQLNVVCAGCRYRYYVLRGTLVETPGRQVTLRYFDQLKRNEHSIVLDTANGDRVTLPYRPHSNRSLAWLRARIGQPIAFVQTVRHDKFEELVWVRAIRTAEDFMVSKPGRRSTVRALWWAVAALCGTGLVVLSVTNTLAALGLSVLASILTFFVVARRMDPRERLSPAEIAHLEHVQGLVRKKVSLVMAKDLATADVARKMVRARGWSALSRRMRRVNEQAYAGRIKSLDRACELLQEQVSVHRRLVSAYDKAIAMTDVEMESSRLEALGSDGIMDAESSVEELRQELLELERQLTAHVEVDHLLTGPPSGE